jgi:Arc/MetJ-type ribon-helix-helix transcriptional regulator
VELNPEIERWVQQEIQRGHFHSVEEAIEQAISALRNRSHAELAPVRKPKKNFAQFLMDSPLPGSGLKLDREKDHPRPIEL